MVSLIERGFLATLARDGRDLQITSTRAKVRATVNQLGALELNSIIGDDPRGDAIIEIRKTGAPRIMRGDELTDVISGEKWKVIRLKFACPRYALQFEVMQLTQKDA